MMASTTNCFAEQALAFAACMPMRATPATLGADQMTCTFQDGVRVVLNTPISNIQTEEQEGGTMLTVYNSDGSTCGQLTVQVTSGGDFIGVNDCGWNMDFPDNTYQLYCASKTYSASMTKIADCKPPVQLPAFDFVEPEMPGSAFLFSLSSAATSSTLFTCE
jgi:hypothetical protein